MLLPQLLALTVALAPTLVSAALFPKDSLVKMIDAKQFKKVMKENVCRAMPRIRSLFRTHSRLATANEHCGVRSALVWGMPLSLVHLPMFEPNRHISTVNNWRRSTARLLLGSTL